MVGYPKWFSKKLITICFLILFISGVALIPNVLIHRFEMDAPFEISGNFRLIITSLHMFAMYLVMFILGGISIIHVKIGLKKNQNKFTGFLLFILFGILALSGLGILYAGAEKLISISSVTHLLVGIVLIFVYFLHQFLKKPY